MATELIIEEVLFLKISVFTKGSNQGMIIRTKGTNFIEFLREVDQKGTWIVATIDANGYTVAIKTEEIQYVIEVC